MKLSFVTLASILLANALSSESFSVSSLHGSLSLCDYKNVRVRHVKTLMHAGNIRNSPDMTPIMSLNTVTVDTSSDIEVINGNEQTTSSKSYLDDGFVFGLEGSGIERPKGKVANIVVEGDSLETEPYQIAMVVGTFLGHFYFAALAMSQLLSQNSGDMFITAVESMAVILSSWVLADLGSGVLHWSVDNYGNGRTPVMGNIIAAFQGHHSAPWTITEREFCNNVYKLCIPFGVPTITVISLLAGPSHPMITLFFTVFCAMEIMSQEFHKWSHMTKGQVSPQINWLQEAGITIGRKPHALHHMAPYEGNYCIISGVCNNFLDQSGFFRRLEHMIYNWNGVESNAWKLDAELKAKTLNGDYRSDI